MRVEPPNPKKRRIERERMADLVQKRRDVLAKLV